MLRQTAHAPRPLKPPVFSARPSPACRTLCNFMQAIAEAKESMESARAQSVVATEEQEILALMQEVDALAQSSQQRWTEKRTHERKKLRVACEVRFIGPDGDTVLSAQSRTREVSMGGMSYVSRQHFRRQTQVLVSLAPSAAPPKRLPGVVVYSRRLREGWFLTGLKFIRAQDARLSPETYAQVQAVDVQALNQQAQPASPDEKATPRERMLKQLASASVATHRSKETVDRVILASMTNDHVVRQASVPVLMNIGGQQAIICLIRLLNDDNPAIQGDAAEALGLMRTPQAMEPLRALVRDTNKEVAVRAAEALGRLGDQTGLRLCIRHVLMEGELSRRAAKALGAIVGKEFRPNAEGVEQARRYLRTSGL
jgi:HEAT repeats/PilZ domain